MSTVLENYYDPGYEPTEQEVEDYGKWLGLDLPSENHLLWIAKSGLKAPLPENWKACKSEKGELYYFNFRTGQSIWDHPSDDKFKEQVTAEREKAKSGKSSEEEAAGGEEPTATAAPTKSSKKEKHEHKSSKAKEKISKTSADLPDSNTKESDAKEEEESHVRKGTKLAHLKTLKGGRKSTVVLVDEPTSHASPHAKTKELAPVLKKKEPLKPLVASTIAAAADDLSPPPKNPNAEDLSRPVSPTPSSTSPNSTSGTDKEQQQTTVLETAALQSQASGSPTSKDSSVDKALATYKAREEQRLEQEKNTARASFDNLLKQAKEQLAENHNRKVESLVKEYERKLEDTKSDVTSKHKRSLEKFVAEMDATLQLDKNKIQNQVATDIEELKKKETAELKSAHKATLVSMKGEYDKEIERIRVLQKNELERVHSAAIPKEEADALAADGLTTVKTFVEEHTAAMETLMAQFSKETMSSELQELREQAVVAKKEIEKQCALDVEEEKAAGLKAVEAFRAEFNAKFEEEKRSSGEKLKTLMDCNEAERRRANEHHDSTMKTLRTEHQTAKDRLAVRFDEEIEFLNTAHSTRLAELQQEMQGAFEARKASLADHFHGEEQILRGDVSHVHRSQSDAESDDAEAAEMLRNFPSPKPEEEADAVPLDATAKPSSAKLAEALPAMTHPDLRATIFEVVQNVLQTHPALRPAAPKPQGTHEDDSESATAETGGYEDEVESPGLPKRVVLGDRSNVVTSTAKGTDMSFHGRQGFAARSTMPTSYVEQQDLLSQEHQRVQEAKQFVSMQRAILNERRTKLKTARRNWKQDVMEAKSHGTTAGSSQASLLRKIQKVLDQQAAGLAHDEEVLKNSEEWLLIKETRVTQLTEDLAVRGDCDLSALSIDTQQLMAPLRDGVATPSKPLRSALKDSDRNIPSSSSAAAAAAAKEKKKESSRNRDAMERIETRLDAMATLITATATRGLPSRPSEGAKLAKGALIPAADPNTVHHHHSSSATRRKRSSSGTRHVGSKHGSVRHVDFAAGYPTGNGLLM